MTVCEGFDGRVSILRDGRPLAFRVLAEGEPSAAVEDERSVRFAVDWAKARHNGRTRTGSPPQTSLEAGGEHRHRAHRGSGAVNGGSRATSNLLKRENDCLFRGSKPDFSGQKPSFCPVFGCF